MYKREMAERGVSERRQSVQSSLDVKRSLGFKTGKFCVTHLLYFWAPSLPWKEWYPSIRRHPMA